MKFNPTVSLFLLFVVLVATSLTVRGQVLHYEIVKGGDVIGEMVAKKEISGKQMVYSISSVTNFRMLVKLRVDYNLTETYEGGVLKSGHAISTLNGAVQKESKVERRANNYHIERGSDYVTYPAAEIRYSIPEIYFTEPVAQTKVFSQVFGDDLIIERLGNHQYQLDSEDGRNTYTYTRGVCSEVKVSRSYATFYIRLKSD
ncbi:MULTISPECIES: DUF6134 family protein [Reichenbachiella]|uniref:DUF6134 family protein n=1 Tax=Reichenbachiella TaxID=156993 RepID=UPI0011C3EA8F|nr:MULTISPECIES: DUF6134 family protein [Reichenbachiella]MBU2915635.1 hypothetical protein [Reichenbachiella agariperforans]